MTVEEFRGPLAEIKDYVLELVPDVKILGKVFGETAAAPGSVTPADGTILADPVKW